MQRQLEKILNKVSKELNIPYDDCCTAYMSEWHFIREKISSLPLKDVNVEEFKGLRPNFNLPSLGKFYVTEDTFNKTKKNYEFLQKIRERHVQDKGTQADLQSYSDDL